MAREGERDGKLESRLGDGEREKKSRGQGGTEGKVDRRKEGRKKKRVKN